MDPNPSTDPTSKTHEPSHELAPSHSGSAADNEGKPTGEHFARTAKDLHSETPVVGPLGASGFSLGHLFRVAIWVDWSLLIIFALIAFNLGFAVFPTWHPQWSLALVWAVSLGASVLFFGSVLAHELAHALVARAFGVHIKRITLFLFGGLAELEEEPKSPGSELLIAMVGPLTSLVIGLGSLLAAGWLAAPFVDFRRFDPALFLSMIGPTATLLLWLGPINVVLAVFNLVPGFPLDGGRMLRAVFWWGTADLTKATRWAANTGRVIAWALMGVGVVIAFDGGILQGLWLVLIGWFLNNAARTSLQQRLLTQALAGVTLDRVMRTDLKRVDPDMRLEDLAHEMLWSTSGQHAYPVERDGALVGLICLHDMRRIPHERWLQTSVADAMTPIADLVTLPVDAGAQRALDELSRRDIGQIPVVRGAPRSPELMGIVRREDVLRWVGLQHRHAA